MLPMARFGALLLLLLLQTCAADRYILQSILDCSKAHPACNSCSVRKTSPNGLVFDSELLCRGCSAPRYKLFNENTTSTCGKEGATCVDQQAGCGDAVC